jgi:peptide/nickel transport system permease protein
MATAARSLRLPKRARSRLATGWGVRISIAVIALALLAAVFGPLLAPQDPNASSLLHAFESPSSDYFLGTDGSGRDIFSRLLVGARSTVLGPLAVAVLATLVGSLLGIVSAWRGGFTDRVTVRAMDVIFAFPGLLVAILAVAMFGKGLLAPSIALTIVYVPYVGRIVRSASLRERSLPYIQALTLQGLSASRICVRHLLPNIGGIVAAQAVIAFSYALIDLAAINFLGFGIQPPQADWGAMVASGQSSILDGHYQEALFAGLCIVGLIVAVNVVGERLSPDEDATVR